jgi:poly(3-hydroxybutyrate) depolymerase
MIPFDSASLYHVHEMQRASLTPLRMMAGAVKALHNSPLNPYANTHYGRSVAASCELVERITQRYPKPEFGIRHTHLNGKRVDITEEVLASLPFCRLLRFKKSSRTRLPKLLMVAPMSGHHATLLRGTVDALLPHFDIAITDWMDAREVPQNAGGFSFADYVDYLMRFFEILGPNTHSLAVCQPSVPLLAAVALMNENGHPTPPRTMTLMGGPIDTRENPTKVNQFAKEHSLGWFENHVISRVPYNYPGFMRRVYPGFLQLTGFMTMNWERHLDEHVKLFQHLVKGDGESADAHRKFYNEYLSVADLPAEFYLDTIDAVFHRHALPKGELEHRGQRVKPEAIRHTALLTIEGELDDISGVGQTAAAHKICVNLSEDRKHHHLQKNVGHYGIFNGRRFREHVVPVITGFAHAQK